MELNALQLFMLCLGKPTIVYESAATEESTLPEALIAQQSHPGARGELHLVPIGHTLIEYVATVEAGLGEHLHDLGVVLNLLVCAAEVSLQRRRSRREIYYRKWFFLFCR